MKITFTIFLSLLFFQVTAQSNFQWGWISGDSTRNAPTVYGVQGVASPGNKPGGRLSSASWVDKNGNVWIFGGAFQPNYPCCSNFLEYNELWKYNPGNGMWTWIKGTNLSAVYGVKGVPGLNNIPAPRHDMVTWTDISGNLWLFGGYSNDHQYNDLWKYDIAIGMWAWMSGDSIPDAPGVYGTMGVEASGNTPSSRNVSGGWTDKNGKFWLYGGTHNSPNDYILPSDMWKYDPVTNMWTWVSGDPFNLVAPSATNPGNRRGFATTVDSSGKFYLFGGQYSYWALHQYFSDPRNDLWQFDPQTKQWLLIKADANQNYGVQGVPSTTNYPARRYACNMWKDREQGIWIFGGFRNDLWKFDLLTQKWTWIKGPATVQGAAVYGTQGAADSANIPGARAYCSSWKDTSGNFYLFAGQNGSQSAHAHWNDVWKFGNPFTGSGPVTHFRTRASGDWESANTWESSPVADFSSGVVSPATLIPDERSKVITIRNGHTVTIKTNLTLDEFVIESAAKIIVDKNVKVTIK